MHPKHLFISSALLLLLSSCTGNMMKAGADADSTAVADSDSLAPSVLSSVFGKIPAIYEAEMLAITEQARQESGNNAQAMRGIMANLADSAYKVAEEKSLHEIVSMQGAIVRCSADEGLPYTIAPEAHVLTTLRPELTNVGGAQRVFVQMKVKSDSITKRAYYVLRGKEGDVAVGSMNLPLSTQQEKTVAVIVAPNAPARYLAACSEIHFVSQDTYSQLRPKVRQQQKAWREEYAKEQGLEIINE